MSLYKEITPEIREAINKVYDTINNKKILINIKIEKLSNLLCFLQHNMPKEEYRLFILGMVYKSLISIKKVIPWHYWKDVIMSKLNNKQLEVLKKLAESTEPLTAYDLRTTMKTMYALSNRNLIERTNWNSHIWFGWERISMEWKITDKGKEVLNNG